MKDQAFYIKAALALPIPIRIKALLDLANIQQKEISITHGKSRPIICATINHCFKSNPARKAIYNSLKAKLPELEKFCPSYEKLWEEKTNG
jgi:hypothetical protein